MNTTLIRGLKANVSKEEALRAYSSAGPSGLYWRIHRGPLQRLANVYVPFSVYTVRYRMGRSTHERIVAMDSVDGSLDLFQFPRVPTDEELATVATRNLLPSSLPESRARDLLQNKVLRIIFQEGFFKLRDPQIEIRREALELHLPYWLGFYGKGTLRCRVLDAVRRRFEGAKASHFFEAWLAA